MSGFRHPFFNPLWRRIATAGACLGWGAFELMAGGGPLWAVIFLGLGATSAWVFFVDWTDIKEDTQ